MKHSIDFYHALGARAAQATRDGDPLLADMCYDRYQRALEEETDPVDQVIALETYGEAYRRNQAAFTFWQNWRRKSV